jgi:hypothetical protein
MASNNMSELGTLNRGVVVIAGSFAPNGSSAVAASSRKGRGFSVARSSAGLFVITLAKKYNDLLAGTATLQLASSDDKFAAQLGAVDMSARTVEIRVRDLSDAALADVSANAGNRVNFVLYLSNTKQVPSAG